MQGYSTLRSTAKDYPSNTIINMYTGNKNGRHLHSIGEHISYSSSIGTEGQKQAQVFGSICIRGHRPFQRWESSSPSAEP